MLWGSARRKNYKISSLPRHHSHMSRAGYRSRRTGRGENCKFQIITCPWVDTLEVLKQVAPSIRRQTHINFKLIIGYIWHRIRILQERIYIIVPVPNPWALVHKFSIINIGIGGVHAAWGAVGPIATLIGTIELLSTHVMPLSNLCLLLKREKLTWMILGSSRTSWERPWTNLQILAEHTKKSMTKSNMIKITRITHKGSVLAALNKWKVLIDLHMDKDAQLIHAEAHQEEANLTWTTATVFAKVF